MAFFMWLPFKFQLPAAPKGHVILELKYLGKFKIYTWQNTKVQRQSRFRVLLYFNFGARRGCVVSTIPWPLYHWDRTSTIFI